MNEIGFMQVLPFILYFSVVINEFSGYECFYSLRYEYVGTHRVELKLEYYTHSASLNE